MTNMRSTSMRGTSALMLMASLVLVSPAPVQAAAPNYKNFDVAVYCRAYEVRQMKDPAWLETRWAAISKLVKVDKVYLETHRDMIVVDQETLDKAKAFFKSKGVKVAGGITATVSEMNNFQTFCYSNPEHRTHMKKVVELTARNFDEFILDDFFYTSCKDDGEIQAKGNKSWTEFRLAEMDEAARNVVLGPAKAVNPKVKVVIKYPNWYDHFQNLGFNLETEPKYFDGIYSGTETRDGVNDFQHLQPYHGYSIVRYFENIKPGGNGGGWVDPFGRRSFDHYAQQLWLTLFAKAREITLFDIRSIYQPPPGPDAKGGNGPTVLSAAGHAFEQVDAFLGKLGKPVGVKVYKPYHSSGDDFLPSYLGMVGMPMDIVPAFPTEDKTILLTAASAKDPGLVAKIKQQLAAGKNVVITTGLLAALQGKGIEDIVELDVTGKTVASRDFFGWGLSAHSDTAILLPHYRYATNDAWEVVSAQTSPSKTSSTPLLLRAQYSKGWLYVLTIPQAVGDLYALPQEVLRSIRRVVAGDLFVQLDAPDRVGLFAYDNNTFIVENFRESPTTAKMVLDARFTKLRDLVTDEVITGKPLAGGAFRGAAGPRQTVFETPLGVSGYRVFAAE